MFSVTAVLLAAMVLLLFAYVVFMSHTHSVFRQLGIPGPKPWPLLGTMHHEFFGDEGMFYYHIKSYLQYKKDKVYGLFRAQLPTLVICDLDMIREICVKQFDNFANRQTFDIDGPLSHALTELKDEHWKGVRSTVSPSFSTIKLKKMFPHIKRNTDILVEHLRGKMETQEDVELRDLVACFTMDTIASTGFGAEVNSIQDEGSSFTKHGQYLFGGYKKNIFLSIFLNFLKPFFNKLGFKAIPKETDDFFASFIDQMYTSRQHEDNSTQADFIQLLMEAQSEHTDDTSNTGGLSYKDIQGQVMVFMMAGYDTVATALSLTLFHLAVTPPCLLKAQQEVDAVLGGRSPDYESVNSLTYLEMCITETLRLFPPGLIIDRMVHRDTVVGGLKIPGGISVTFPVCAIHRDPELWENPDTFVPERHTAESRANRHPYSFMGFGQGPRNCVGMRLAMLEMKTALAAILQTLSPCVCHKSVFPIRLDKHQVKAVDGLWVKFEPRSL